MKRSRRLPGYLRRTLDRQLVPLLLAATLLTVALIAPKAALERQVFEYVFVLDITQSMNVMDAGPETDPVSRIDLARSAVLQSLEELPCGSEAGLAIFTEYRAFLLVAPVEVCRNYGVLAAMLERVDWRMAWAARSEVAKGLYSGLLLAAQLGADTRLVFLSDGHEAPPVHPDFRPRFTGNPGDISGVVIGIGGAAPAPIPQLDEQGEVTGYWAADEVPQVDTFSLGRSSSVAGEGLVGVDTSDLEDRIGRGTEHLSSLREAYLTQLAEETRLEYVRLQTPGQLAGLLTQSRFADHEVVATDLRWIPGLLGLLSLAWTYVDGPLLGRRARRRHRAVAN